MLPGSPNSWEDFEEDSYSDDDQVCRNLMRSIPGICFMLDNDKFADDNFRNVLIRKTVNSSCIRTCLVLLRSTIGERILILWRPVVPWLTCGPVVVL